SAYMADVPGVVKTIRLLCFTVRRSIQLKTFRTLASGGYSSPVNGSFWTIGSLKSATHGSRVRRFNERPIMWAVAIGYVDQITSGRCLRIREAPRPTALGHHVIHLSGRASH